MFIKTKSKTTNNPLSSVLKPSHFLGTLIVIFLYKVFMLGIVLAELGLGFSEELLKFKLSV